MRSNRVVIAASQGLFVGFLSLSIGLGTITAEQMPQMPQMPPVPQMPSIPSPDQAGPPPPTAPISASQNYGSQGAGFVGGWCAQGDPTKQTSISYNGVMYNLTNETGDTSVGNPQGNNQIVAPGWQFVTGTLNQGGRQIQWSNGTFWARCPSGGGGGGGGRALNLNGNWYPNGNRSQQCSIQQHRGNLTLQNENGQRATGSINGRFHLTTNWQGTTISGTVTRDGNRINWDNGTYWIRYRLYTQ
jgi:hypothetical protein